MYVSWLVGVRLWDVARAILLLMRLMMLVVMLLLGGELLLLHHMMVIVKMVVRVILLVGMMTTASWLGHVRLCFICLLVCIRGYLLTGALTTDPSVAFDESS